MDFADVIRCFDFLKLSFYSLALPLLNFYTDERGWSRSII